MSDGDRANAAIQARRTPNRGVPVQRDEELTPPPMEPPLPSSAVQNFDTIAPPIQEALDLLGRGQHDLIGAVQKLWDIRGDGKRLDRIELNLGALAAATTRAETTISGFLGPAVKDLMAAVDGLGQQIPRFTQQLETTSSLLAIVDDRLRRLEGDLRVMSAEFSTAREASAQRHAEHSARLKELDNRLDVVERKDRDREVTTRALAKSERRKSGAVGAGIAAVVSAIVTALVKAFS